MNGITSIAALDLRRLALGNFFLAFAAAFVPGMSQAFGEGLSPQAVLTMVLIFVGITAGECFGSDFTEGRSSFYFARPLPTSSLFVGRIAAMLTLALGALATFVTFFWLASKDRDAVTLDFISRNQFYVLLAAWTVAFFMRLAIAANVRKMLVPSAWKDLIRIPPRLIVLSTICTVTFGLFVDIAMRAYPGKVPITVFLGSWTTAMFVACVIAITLGRTDTSRIARLLNRVLVVFMVVMLIAVSAAWAYLLHPRAENITGVAYAAAIGGEKNTYLTVEVDRGEQPWIRPVFSLDVPTGHFERLSVGAISFPSASRDGNTLVWHDTRPAFLRPVARLLGNRTDWRVRVGGIDRPLPLPDKIEDADVGRILPSNDGDVIALLARDRLWFVSLSGKVKSSLDLKEGGGYVRSLAFTSEGRVRAALGARGNATGDVRFVEIDPATGRSETLTTLPGPLSVLFDDQAARALAETSGDLRSVSVSLLEFGVGGTAPRITPLFTNALVPQVMFLQDGRIAAGYRTSGAPRRPIVQNGQIDPAFRNSDRSALIQVFSPGGAPLLTAPATGWLSGEVFPGIGAVPNVREASQDTDLVDLSTGAVVRTLKGVSPLNRWLREKSTGVTARLMRSPQGRLYEVPSMTAEPRLLAPRE
jgi:hypothetical protein